MLLLLLLLAMGVSDVGVGVGGVVLVFPFLLSLSVMPALVMGDGHWRWWRCVPIVVWQHPHLPLRAVARRLGGGAVLGW
jgi:hypothetical protein